MCLLLFGPVLGCEQQEADERPEGVVEEFVARMNRVHGDPRAARAAYELLWAEGRQNLADRAKRASAVTGQKLAPEDMLAPSRLWMRETPRKLSARVAGSWAEVIVTTDDPASGPHAIRCVEEDGRWRVALELPQLAPIEHRSEPRR
ncbi:MAG: hypothetical protein JW751_14755 [Polyangiaceae bacterium]|nr:hypothetical protein [Polyangiaceae bacterium]